MAFGARSTEKPHASLSPVLGQHAGRLPFYFSSAVPIESTLVTATIANQCLIARYRTIARLSGDVNR